MGDSQGHCKAAMREVVKDPRVRKSFLSSLYLASPVSEIAQEDFVNCAIKIQWEGSPEDLLAFTTHVEDSLGRKREVAGGPRTIDLDILLFDDVVLDTSFLTIPHPGLHLRKFALVPCLEIDPFLVHPRYGRPLAEFLKMTGEEQRIEFLERIGE